MPSVTPLSSSSIEDLLKAKAADTGTDTTGNAAPAPRPSGKSAKTPPPITDETKTAKLKEHMAGIELKEKERKTQEMASLKGLPFISLHQFPIAPEAIALISRVEANAAKIISFYAQGNDVRVGIVAQTPETEAVIARLSKEQHAEISPYLISEASFKEAERLYDILPDIKEVIYGYRIEEKDLAKYEQEITNFKILQERITQVSITDVMTLVVGAGLRSSASDIHVEAEEDDINVRFRIDGILHDAARMPAASWKQVIARLKLLAGVKINVEQVPQDGRITIYLSDEKIDIRASFLPTAYGESVVLRILRPKSIALEFDKLGIRGLAAERLAREIERPNGMIITTGPTGSGKTTTLYAILKKLNSSEVKIITLEDPIEYKLKGINQSQIEHEKNYDFAKGLRSILRQDPDVVMVGEIRDLETAEISIQAALTGHLVVSTIHTNSAAGAIPRFLSMGVKPFLLAPALNAVIGQRLIRRLCEKCKVPATLTPSQLREVTETLRTIPASSREQVDMNKLAFMGPGKGCEACNNMGYKGRVGMYEIFTMSKGIEEAILAANVSEYKIADIAVQEGMVTMAQDGLIKALQGLTSIEEVLAAANIDTTVEEPIEEKTSP
ncbi:type II/IV secretion system protein [Patescibacteria group bacterium]|nr:type II/IV secretion system protein [Patescibacteria group bacterium]MBP9709515.1 type II/IV secretion system protein [Patescibacteria group bacterium]